MYYAKEVKERCQSNKLAALRDEHERHGHINEKDLKNIVREKKVFRMRLKLSEKLPPCEICIKGK